MTPDIERAKQLLFAESELSWTHNESRGIFVKEVFSPGKPRLQIGFDMSFRRNPPEISPELEANLKHLAGKYQLETLAIQNSSIAISQDEFKQKLLPLMALYVPKEVAELRKATRILAQGYRDINSPFSGTRIDVNVVKHVAIKTAEKVSEEKTSEVIESNFGRP